MAKTKETRGSKYREIVEGMGVRYEDCRVLAFRFERERGPELFHYALMLAENRPEYLSFDCEGLTANVIVHNVPEDVDKVTKMALADGGTPTMPNLR